MKKNALIRRIIQIVIVLFGISFLAFLLTYLAPGDPVLAMYTANGAVPNPEVLESTRAALGLDRPFLIQYGVWLWNSLQGDFGISYTYNIPVTELLLARLWPTLKLALFSFVLMLAVSVPLGILTAIKQNKFADYIVRVLSFFGISMPNFWIGLLLLWFFAVLLGWLPVVSSGEGFASLILPGVTLAIGMSAKYTRQVRTFVLEELNSDYVTGALCRGVRRRKILFRHVLPNSFLPLLTLMGLSFGSLLGGTAVVEVIFSYPGLGNLVVSAVKAMDYNVIQACVLWIALIYMGINLAVDLVTHRLDPRIREGVRR